MALLVFTTSSKARSFLVIGSDGGLAKTVCRVLCVYRRAECIRPDQIDEWSREHRAPLGVVVDGRELEALAALRKACPYVPAIAIAESTTASEVERGYQLRASHVSLESEGLLPFVFRCLTEEAVSDERVGCLVESLVRGGIATAREAELLVLVLADIPREEIAERMCITENTVKAHTRQLLRKLDASDLDKLAARIFRVALQSGGRVSWPPRGSGEQPAVRGPAPAPRESGKHRVADVVVALRRADRR